MKKLLFFFFSLAIFSVAPAQTKKSPVKKTATKKTVVTKKTAPKIIKVPVTVAPVKTDRTVRIKITTDSGIMVVKLYDSTPLHRDNFVKLVQQKFYDSLLFHRVIQGFMIQGGDPMSKNAAPATMLGNGGGDMANIPAEFRQHLYHKRGVLAAARDGNPEKASSACQFYLVQGKKLSDAELDALEVRKGIKYTPEEREHFKNDGGTPFLDMDYTVFGEVESGLEVIDKIAGVSKDAANRPLGDVRMYMEILEK